jgi:hypothetical protein
MLRAANHNRVVIGASRFCVPRCRRRSFLRFDIQSAARIRTVVISYEYHDVEGGCEKEVQAAGEKI